MRRNVIAATLVVAGVLLLGTGLSGVGLFSPTPRAAAPLAGTRFTGDRPHQPDLLPGVHSASVAVDPNTAVGFLSIPRIGVNNAPIFDRGLDGNHQMVIAHGYAVTHFQYSSAIGAGNAVLYGHDDIEGSVFARLKDLQPGDQIDVTVPGLEPVVYKVVGRRIVAPTAVQILQPTEDARLTLFTCWPNWVDTQRVVVTAVPI